ncbi:MAG: class I SAM-dependent methyltransferase [Thermosynechococcaceae cyanobacterium]
MSSPELSKYRQEILANLNGEILEIGFGTGLNLPFYPTAVHKLTTVDVNPGMNVLAQRRILASAIKVEQRVLNGEQLPMADNTFDHVVSTWTLCSISQVDMALDEIYRVLKPGGTFIFIEHGLSDVPKIQVWQNRLTPLQKVIGDGCHLNRNIEALIEKHFDSVKLERFVMKDLPAIAAYTYKGTATKRAIL